MDVKTVKIVIVIHQNDMNKYIFRVPKDICLKVGDRVLCETAKSPCEMGRCVTPSFDIIEPQLLELYGRKISNLKPVIGYLKPVMFAVERVTEE